MRIIKMMSGSLFPITEDEFKNLTKVDGLIYIPSSDQMVNTKSIESIQTHENFLKNLKLHSNEGILKDGTRIIKQFGIWKLKNNPDLKLDYSYYPEIAKDEVELISPLEDMIKKLEIK